MDKKTKPMAERIGFDIVGSRGDTDMRIYTDGDNVAWTITKKGSTEGTVGFVPRCLFLLAARTLAERCESEAHSDSWDTDSALFHAASENLVQPIVQAMGWPFGSDPWDEEDPISDLDNGTRFGFDGQISSTSIDGPPAALRDVLGEDNAR